MFHVGRISGDNHNQGTDAGDIFLESIRQKSEGIKKYISQGTFRCDGRAGDEGSPHEEDETHGEEGKYRIHPFQDEVCRNACRQNRKKNQKCMKHREPLS